MKRDTPEDAIETAADIATEALDLIRKRIDSAKSAPATWDGATSMARLSLELTKTLARYDEGIKQ